MSKPSSRNRTTEVSGAFASLADGGLAVDLALARVDLVEAAAHVVVAGALALERVELTAELDHLRLRLLGGALGRGGLRLGWAWSRRSEASRRARVTGTGAATVAGVSAARAADAKQTGQQRGAIAAVRPRMLSAACVVCWRVDRSRWRQVPPAGPLAWASDGVSQRREALRIAAVAAHAARRAAPSPRMTEIDPDELRRREREVRERQRVDAAVLVVAERSR